MHDPTPIIHSTPAPLYKVAGTHREIGRQIGESAKEQVQRSIENAKMLISSAYDELQLDWGGALIQSRKYLPFAQEKYPQYVDEIAGIAEGAGVSFDDVAVLNAMEAVTSDALHLEKCTSMAVNNSRTADEHVLVAHNEDWLPWDEADVYLVHVSANDEPPFLAMTYGGLLPNIGLNSEGISQCCDSVYPNDSRIGIPRILVSRAILAAKNLSQALSAALIPQRAAGYNHLLAHESGELYNVEVSARQFAILYALDGILAHSNHYLDANMQAIESEPDELISTRIRYYRTLRLLSGESHHSIKSLKNILRDHTNMPESICRHDEDHSIPLDRQKTVNSLIMDLTARTMHLAWGNPCVNKYHTYYLDA
jgi:isopenicillin-N N-acyltransferase like protein